MLFPLPGIPSLYPFSATFLFVPWDLAPTHPSDIAEIGWVYQHLACPVESAYLHPAWPGWPVSPLKARTMSNSVIFFFSFLTALLRYNWDIIKSTLLKCTVHFFLFSTLSEVWNYHCVIRTLSSSFLWTELWAPSHQNSQVESQLLISQKCFKETIKLKWGH